MSVLALVFSTQRKFSLNQGKKQKQNNIVFLRIFVYILLIMIILFTWDWSNPLGMRNYTGVELLFLQSQISSKYCPESIVTNQHH